MIKFIVRAILVSVIGSLFWYALVMWLIDGIMKTGGINGTF